MRTKQEVINFLESKVGTKAPCKGNSSLDGQCVTLIKVLMEFLGVPDPYKARGHAKTVISAYLSEGVADPGNGFLSVFSNKDMGDGYGHIWCNAGDGDGTYYESNGQKPLIVTKGKTYSYDNVCNFDKYIKTVAPTPEPGEPMDLSEVLKRRGVKTLQELDAKIEEAVGPNDEWGNESKNGGFLGSARRRIKELEAQPVPPTNPEQPPTVIGWEANGLQIVKGEKTWNYQKKA